MCVLFAGHGILHDQLFIDWYVEENATVGQDGLLHCVVYPIVQPIAWVTMTSEWPMDDIGEEFPVNFVLVSSANVARKRGRIE